MPGRLCLGLAVLLTPPPTFATAQPRQPPSVEAYAAGLAVMVDEAHVREIHLQAELAATRQQLVAAQQQLAKDQRQIAELTAKSTTVSPGPAAPPAAEPSPAEH